MARTYRNRKASKNFKIIDGDRILIEGECISFWTIYKKALPFSRFRRHYIKKENKAFRVSQMRSFRTMNRNYIHGFENIENVPVLRRTCGWNTW